MRLLDKFYGSFSERGAEIKLETWPGFLKVV
jgi:hypothetical protein